MTKAEIERYDKLREKFNGNKELAEYIDLYMKVKLNDVNIKNKESQNVDGIIKEIAGINSFRVDTFVELEGGNYV